MEIRLLPRDMPSRITKVYPDSSMLAVLHHPLQRRHRSVDLLAKRHHIRVNSYQMPTKRVSSVVPLAQVHSANINLVVDSFRTAGRQFKFIFWSDCLFLPRAALGE